MHAFDFLCTAMVSMQVLMSLPDNLLVSVLRSSPMTLIMQLNSLPSGLHVAALHAAHPSIAADHSLKLGNKKLLINPDAEALGRVIARLSSLQHLELQDNCFWKQGARALGPHLAKLSSLQHLDIRENSIGGEGAKALGPHLSNLTSCLLYTSPSPRDRTRSRMPSSA